MMQKDLAIVFDCGATNLRVIAIDSSGRILAAHALPNQTDEDPNWLGGKIWDIDKLWSKFCEASKIVAAQIDTTRIAGVTVTTFGVDGTFVDKNGNLLYPVISWQCQRLTPIMNNIEKYIPLEHLYKISGVFPYAFNTINKLVWFKENRPEIIEKAHRFVFIPSLFIHKLTGLIKNDATMLGTAMIADLSKRDFSDKILNAIGLDKETFGSIAEPGDSAGQVHSEAAKASGLPQGTPVFFAGHDTQFAIFGSGAQLNQPVLSSGTWEILMTRSNSYTATAKELANNLTTEADAEKGIYNIGQNWLASGVLEWFSRHFYAGLQGAELYNLMIKEAEQEIPGTGGLLIDPAFYNDSSSAGSGLISGLTIETSRSQLYRAFLESLAFRLREGLEALEGAGKFKAHQILCVGGGSKNRLWNQLRADVCNIPIHIIDQKETTVLGASMFVFAGSGLYQSTHDMRNRISYNQQVVTPSNNSTIYDTLYQKYKKLKSNTRQNKT